MMRILLLAALSILVAVAFVRFVPSAGQDLRVLEGTWQPTSDEANKSWWLRLWMENDREDSSVGFTLTRGFFEAEGIFGDDFTAGAWNFASLQPLRLNIIADNKSLVAAVKLSIDGNQMTLFASQNHNEVAVKDWDKHPNAIRLTRTE